MDVNIGAVTLNVLGYREEAGWVALALEMDLRGYGNTFQAALKELVDLVSTQVEFAHFKGQPEILWKPAEPVWFERFADAGRERLNALVNQRDLAGSSYDVAGLQIRPGQMAGPRSKFSPAEA